MKRLYFSILVILISAIYGIPVLVHADVTTNEYTANIITGDVNNHFNLTYTCPPPTSSVQKKSTGVLISANNIPASVLCANTSQDLSETYLKNSGIVTQTEVNTASAAGKTRTCTDDKKFSLGSGSGTETISGCPALGTDPKQNGTFDLKGVPGIMRDTNIGGYSYVFKKDPNIGYIQGGNINVHSLLEFQPAIGFESKAYDITIKVDQINNDTFVAERSPTDLENSCPNGNLDPFNWPHMIGGVACEVPATCSNISIVGASLSKGAGSTGPCEFILKGIKGQSEIDVTPSTGTAWFKYGLPSIVNIAPSKNTQPPTPPKNVSASAAYSYSPNIPATPNNVALNKKSAIPSVTTPILSINVSWDPSTSPIGISGYYVIRSGGNTNGYTGYVLTTINPSYMDTNVSFNASYSYTVLAYDTEGNFSQASGASISIPPYSPTLTDLPPSETGSTVVISPDEIMPCTIIAALKASNYPVKIPNSFTCSAVAQPSLVSNMTIPATPLYSCPSDYTLNTTNKTCLLLLNNSISVPAIRKSSCQAGYIPVFNGGSLCKSTSGKLASAAITYSCPTSYVLNGTLCKRSTIIPASVIYSCPSNYTLNATDNTCSTTPISNSLKPTTSLNAKPAFAIAISALALILAAFLH